MSDYATPIDLLRPGLVRFGAGQIRHLAADLAERGARRVLVVADAFNAARVDVLGIKPAEVFGAVEPEPGLATLEALLAAARRLAPDAVVGFGGGSAMDCAKLAAVLAGDDRPLAAIAGKDRAPPRACLLVQVPTTAGTGSEAGTRALVTDPATLAKIAVESRHMLADVAVIDPAMTASLPPAVTAATGVDALAHCTEAFTSRRAHPLIDAYALEGIRLVGRFLPRAVANGADAEARAAMALASFYGGVCLGPVNTTAGHALAYPLGTRHDLPHGLANALIFPHVLAANAAAVPEKTALVAEALGFGRSGRPLEAAAVLDGAAAFCRGLGLAMRLSDHGVPETDLPAMAADAHAIRRLLDNNPRDLSVGEIEAIYRDAY